MKSVPVTKRALASHDECVVDAGEGGNVTAEFTKLDVAVHFEIGHFSPAQDLGKIQVRYVFLPLQEEFFSQFVRGPPRC